MADLNVNEVWQILSTFLKFTVDEQINLLCTLIEVMAAENKADPESVMTVIFGNVRILNAQNGRLSFEKKEDKA